MVYQGHLLRPDSAPLSQFTMDLPATLICQISQPNTSNINNATLGATSNDEFDISGKSVIVEGSTTLL